MRSFTTPTDYHNVYCEHQDARDGSYDTLTFTGEAALETLERCPKLITSLGDALDSSNDEQSRAYKLRKAALSVLKRLVGGGFLEVQHVSDATRQQNGATLSDDESASAPHLRGASSTPPSSGPSSVTSSPRPGAALGDAGSATSSPRQTPLSPPVAALSSVARLNKPPPPLPPKPATPALSRRSDARQSGVVAPLPVGSEPNGAGNASSSSASAAVLEPGTPPQLPASRSRSNSRAPALLSPTALDGAVAMRAAMALSSGDATRPSRGTSNTTRNKGAGLVLGPATVFSLTSSSGESCLVCCLCARVCVSVRGLLTRCAVVVWLQWRSCICSCLRVR